MLTDGVAITSDKALVNFAGRGIAQLAFGLLKQLPSSLNVKLDVDTLLQSITYQPEGQEQRLSLDPWPLAPGREGSTARADGLERWEACNKAIQAFFPEGVARTGGTESEEASDEGDGGNGSDGSDEDQASSSRVLRSSKLPIHV